MLRLNSLTIKNFMSIGNVTQSVTFSNNDLVLVLGENLDLGGNDNRNGVGKSTIVNALSYALYGDALTNIKMDNLINKTNMKHLLVTLTFEINGVDYKIIRGRRPSVFKFIKDGVEKDAEDEDKAQGEGKNTQAEIERLIGISHEMFKHILALNTYVQPFLALRSNEQRTIIEQLLGITKLSEKAEVLSKEAKTVRDEIKEEEFRISAATEANKRIEANIVGLEVKKSAWSRSQTTKINGLQAQIEKLLTLDIDREISLHKTKKDVEDLTSEYRSLTKELSTLEKDVSDTNRNLSKLDKVL